MFNLGIYQQININMPIIYEKRRKLMNIKEVIGYSALAGSLAAFSAQAVEMSVSGSAKVTYQNGDISEVTGNAYGMNTSMAFTGSGDVNGYETSLTVVSNDLNTGMSSAV